MKIRMKPTIEITEIDIRKARIINDYIQELIDIVDCNDECEICPFFDVDRCICKIGQLNYYGLEVRRIMEQNYFKEKKEEG